MAAIDSQDPRFLTGNQQDLLRAALASNKPQQRSLNPSTISMPAVEGLSSAIPAFDATDAFPSFDPEDPLLAGFYDGDTSFDVDNTELSGVFPGDLEGNETHDKRKVSDASEDWEEGDSKRREGDDKQAKKPGRKPLTTEPTTKRKAQNRAAQRAFRERKEKHLKDLETKVAELTKDAEIEKQENGLLRAQVERLQAELKEYRSRMASDSSRAQSSSTYKPTTRSDFTFQFPAFGSLPSAGSELFGPKSLSYVKHESNNAVTNGTHTVSRQDSDGQQISPGHSGSAGASPSAIAASETHSPVTRQASSNMQSFAGLFSPGILNDATAATNSPDYGFPRLSNSPISQPMRENSTTSNTGNNRVFRFNSESVSSNTDSPSQSSMSQFNATSSCNTSPAPSQHPSPPKDNASSTNPGLTSINEMSTTNSLHTTPSVANSIDWLASQNGGQFDPVLFGDYRESQDAIVGDGDFNNGFFNEAFPFDFGSPMNFNDIMSPKPAAAVQVPQAGATTRIQRLDKPEPHKSLLAEVEKVQAGGDEDYGLPNVQTDSISKCPKQNGGILGTKLNANMLSANAIWNQLQANKDFQDGKFDLDNLCTELRSKAKCSESGMAVPATEVEKTIKKLSGPSAKDAGHNLIWDEAFVNETVNKLGASSSATWGGFGLTNEQLSQGW